MQPTWHKCQPRKFSLHIIRQIIKPRQSHKNWNRISLRLLLAFSWSRVISWRKKIVLKRSIESIQWGQSKNLSSITRKMQKQCTGGWTQAARTTRPCIYKITKAWTLIYPTVKALWASKKSITSIRSLAKRCHTRDRSCKASMLNINQRRMGYLTSKSVVLASRSFSACTVQAVNRIRFAKDKKLVLDTTHMLTKMWFQSVQVTPLIAYLSATKASHSIWLIITRTSSRA